MRFVTTKAVTCADSCEKSTDRRLQAEAVPTESMHKKLSIKILLIKQKVDNHFYDCLPFLRLAVANCIKNAFISSSCIPFIVSFAELGSCDEILLKNRFLSHSFILFV